MPFVGKSKEDGILAPEQADEDSSYICPACGERLTIRRSHNRGDTFVSRHFWHSSATSNEDCPGESDRHKRMKSIAMSKAGERWESATVHWEASVGDRRADVLVEFPERHHRYGEGIAIECQYKHEEKDTEVVTEDFLNNDYSVLWLYEEQYSGKDVDLDGGDWAIWWIKQIPDQQEWSGYHGIVHWLHQDKPTTVEMTVRIPIHADEVKYKWALKGAWARGVRSQFDDGVSIYLPCSRCLQVVSYWVKCRHKRENRWKATLIGAGESRCSNCGIRNRPTSDRIRLSAQRAVVNRPT